jgi:uncharacterized protein (DUF1330 family)
MNNKKLLPTLIATVMLAATGFTLLRAATVAPKAYVVAEITVTDPEAYKQYAALVPPIAAKFSGRYLVRGGQTIAVEGDPPGGRIVVIEFDTLASARLFEESAEYQAIAPLRRQAARSRVFIAEGVTQ